ncbi:MAG: LysM peptidoglycan-binding domain-containing protein [Chloroflexi bacterium]|nr:LysM peptidoglycan-binding domain-containing protein [Chloroflexota bacterium]
MRPWRFVMLRALLCALLLATAGLELLTPTPAAAYQGANLLQNPGFEEPYVTLNGDPTLRVANSWQPWSLPPGSSTAINARPEYRAAPANRVRSGSAAQEYNTFFATHTGGLYQRVPVSPNTPLQFSVYVYIWSSANFADPNVSENPNDVRVRVGIDPNGGTDGTSPNIVWSSDQEFYDQYRQLSVSATSRSTAVTVFIRSAPQGFVGSTNIYVDDAVLAPQGQAGPTATLPGPSPTPDFDVPTQEGTVTPFPTSVPPPTSAFPTTPAPVPTQRPPATATPVLPGDFDTTITYVVQRGDTVIGLAQRYNSTVDAIARVNGLSNAGLIYVGQTLLIPVRGSQNRPATFTPVPTFAGGPTAIPQPQPGTGTYTVVRGDTLWGIAARFNTTIETLARLSNIVNPHLIFPGQVLVVTGAVQQPIPPTAAPIPPTAAPYPPAQQPLRHVVQPGENLFRISLRYNVTLEALARANGIFNPNLIFVGQVLVIPK